MLLPNIALGQAGTYSVIATNIAGVTNSINAVLTVYPTAAPSLCSAGCSNNGQFHLQVTGVPGYKYAILASTNLINWSALQTNTAPFTFMDTNAAARAGSIALSIFRKRRLPASFFLTLKRISAAVVLPGG